METLISTGQAAAVIGVHRMTVQRMVKSGALEPALTTPIGPLFDPADVEAIRAARAEA